MTSPAATHVAELTHIWIISGPTWGWADSLVEELIVGKPTHLSMTANAPSVSHLLLALPHIQVCKLLYVELCCCGATGSALNRSAHSNWQVHHNGALKPVNVFMCDWIQVRCPSPYHHSLVAVHALH